MESPADRDQKWLLDCLAATLDTSRDVRSFAEASLKQASSQPGFGAALAKITLNKEISFGLRQLASVLLKQFIKQHWQQGDETFVHPVVSPEEKNATECLASFVSGGRRDMLMWGGDPGLTIKKLLDAASRLLDPDLESSGSLFVGSYILQLILNLPPSQMPLHIHELVAFVVRGMQSSEISGLKSSLIVILARLVHLSVPDVDQFINLLLATPAKGYENSLAYAMPEWTKLQVKVTTTALALLLSTRHAALSKINVQGNLVKPSAGITTQSKAKLAPDTWTTIPLLPKIFALLSDALIEIQEQALDDNEEEDSEWEEVSNGESGVQQDILSWTLPSAVNPSVEDLHDMAKALDEEDNDEDYSDELTKVDPLNEIKVADFLTNSFLNLYNTDRSLFDHLFQSLTDVQKTVVKKVISKS